MMDWWYYELLAVVSALFGLLYVWATWHNDTYKQRGIPYMKPTPFLGTMYPFWFGRVSFGDHSLRTYNAFRDKTVVGFFNFRQPTLMIRDPEVLKMITTTDFDHFVDHRPFTRAENDILFGKSLFLLTGTKWKTIRNVLNKSFAPSKLKAMFTLVEECGKQMGEYLEERLQAEGGESMTVDMADLFTRTSNDVIATSAFGLHCDSLRDRDNEFYRMGREVLDFNILVFLGNMIVPRMMKMLNIPGIKHYLTNYFLTLVGDTIRTREKLGIVRPDMIHLLVQAKKGTLKWVDEDAEKVTGTNGIILTDEDITAQVFLFVLAGFSTSSILLCFLSQMLAVHPDVQRRVQHEIDTVLREERGRITYKVVEQKLKYLDMVISETLRLWPSVLETDRICVKTYTIPASGSTPAVKITPGQVITIPIYALQRNPDYFPDPERFDPERFSEDNKNNINEFAYIPFGAGPRGCIGLRFAQMATKITMVALLSRFDLEVTSKTQIPLVFKKNSFNTAIEGGFWLAIKPRTDKPSF